MWRFLLRATRATPREKQTANIDAILRARELSACRWNQCHTKSPRISMYIPRARVPDMSPRHRRGDP